MKNERLKRWWPVLAVVVVLIATALQLHNQGRLWWCACGRLLFWVSDAWGSENSQHLFDPYSLTHVSHGLIFYALLAWILPSVSPRIRLCLSIAIEALWEILENANFIIERYREATAALGYQGDTVVNSLGDVLACATGFLLARCLGLHRSIIVFALAEIALLLTIRDNLILNVIMLIHPIDEIKAWQAGG